MWGKMIMKKFVTIVTIMVMISAGPFSTTITTALKTDSIKGFHLAYKNALFDITDIGSFGQAAWGVATADFNQDGNLDFAAAYADKPITHSEISIFYGDGTGNFTKKDIWSIHEIYINNLNAGDYNNDGYTDILICYTEHDQSGGNTNGTIGILLNDGENNFTTYTRILTLPGRTNPHTTTADFNNDGLLDFVVGDNGGKAELYLNNGDLNFTGTGFIHDWGDVSWGVASGDVDRDGDVDLLIAACTSYPQGGVYLIKNQWQESNHTIIFNQDPGVLVFSLPWQAFTASLTSIDYNHDGAPDFIIGAGYQLYLLLNKNSEFIPYLFCMLTNKGGFTGEDFTSGGMASGDFNHDGYDDLATGGTQGIVRLFLNKQTLAVITYPRSGYVYKFGEEGMSTIYVTILIGKINVSILTLSDVSKIEVYANLLLLGTLRTPPYNLTWKWTPRLMFIHVWSLRIIAYSYDGNRTSYDSIFPMVRIL